MSSSPPPSGQRRAAPGLERTLFRQLPWVLLVGTLLPALWAWVARLFPPEGSAADLAKHLDRIDFHAIALVVWVWTAVFTVAIGCVVVMVMKGPERRADGYKVPDRERPGEDGQGRE